MQNFNDRLLFIVDHVVGKLGLVTTLLDRVMTSMIPQATAMAQSCPSFCGYECTGVCQYGQYEYEVCSFSQTGCQRGETWTNFLGCDC